MEITVLNQKKEKVGEMKVSEKIFGAKWNSDLVHQAFLAQLGNRRDPLAHAKGRGEVRGGGKKPWRQKGTGRARHGSIRSPLWVGGGVTHGPTKERVFSKKINKKMKRLAIFSLISKKMKDNEIIIIDKFDGLKGKTKDWANTLRNLVDLRQKTVLVLKISNKGFSRSLSNIKNIDSLSPLSINVYDLLKNKNIVFEKEAIEEMEKHYK